MSDNLDDLAQLVAEQGAGGRVPGMQPWTYHDPVVKRDITIRKSLTMRLDLQAFWNSKTGLPVGITYVTLQAPSDVVGKFDTIILHPVMYEAVKKSTMEGKARDQRRRELKEKGRGRDDLRNFKPDEVFGRSREMEQAKKH